MGGGGVGSLMMKEKAKLSPTRFYGNSELFLNKIPRNLILDIRTTAL